MTFNPEIEFYLRSRNFGLPTCPPLIATSPTSSRRSSAGCARAAAAATCGSSAAQRSPSECTDLPVDELPD